MKLPYTIGLIAVTKGGLEKARLLRVRLGSGLLFRPERYGPPAHSWEECLPGPLAEQVASLFARFDQLVFFLATGAVTRLIAPCLVSKRDDPGVLVVEEAGRFVIPLLSGHKGGANAFARKVAGCLGATPVITTASDVVGGLSPDTLEEAFGWIAEPTGRLKDMAMSLVNREPMAVIQELGSRGTWLDEHELPNHIAFASASANLPDSDYTDALWITDRLVEDLGKLDSGRILWYRPKSLVLGVGCERGITAEALEDGLDQFFGQHHFSRKSIAILATASLKEDEEGLLGFAGQNGWQLAFFSASELAKQDDIPNPSAVVQRCIGAPGVAEPAALLAAGAKRLLVEKTIVTSNRSPRRMTFALARLAQFSERTPREGMIHFIGAGPGDPQLLTLKAHHLLRQADVLIYAGSLIPEAVLRQAQPTAILHNSAHLNLAQVMSLLLEAYRAGKRVVRLHSGDTSIYSAIQEQIAQLEEQGVPYEVVPGISSFQAAAAALKSELTVPEVVQTIILTRAEGRTPMPERESLKALAQHGATLSVFLSAHLGQQVQDQLLTAYPPETPVAIVYRVTWPDEKMIVTRLDRLAEELRQNHFIRTTLLLVGQAIGARRNQSRLYNEHHGHIYRAPSREENGPVA